MACNRGKQGDVFESKFSKNNIEYNNPDWTQHRDTCLSVHCVIPSAQLVSTLGCEIVEDALDRKMIFPEVLVDGDNDTVEKMNENSVYHSINIDIVKNECITHVMRNMMATFSTEYIDSLKAVTGKTLSEIESRTFIISVEMLAGFTMRS